MKRDAMYNAKDPTVTSSTLQAWSLDGLPVMCIMLMFYVPTGAPTMTHLKRLGGLKVGGKRKRVEKKKKKNPKQKGTKKMNRWF